MIDELLRENDLTERLNEKIFSLREENQELKLKNKELSRERNKIRREDLVNITIIVSIFLFLFCLVSTVVIYPLYKGITSSTTAGDMCYIIGRDEGKNQRTETKDRIYKLYREVEWGNDYRITFSYDINEIFMIAEKVGCIFSNKDKKLLSKKKDKRR